MVAHRDIFESKESFSEGLRCTCFRIRKAARSLTQAYENVMASSGVTPVQMSVMAEIIRHDGQLPISILARYLGTDRTTLTRTVRRMLAAGWLVEKKGRDGRERIIRMTEAGARKYDASVKSWRRAETRVVNAMGIDNLNEVYASLEKLEAIAERLEKS